MIALSSVLTAWVRRWGLAGQPWSEWAITPLALVTGLVVGSSCGFVSGLLVTLVRLQPFVATLAMMTIARGIALVMTEGADGNCSAPVVFLLKGWVRGSFIWEPWPFQC